MTHWHTVILWRTGKGTFNDSTAIKVAKLLETEPAQIIAAVHAERAKNEQEKAIWKDIYERLGGMAAAVLLAVALSGAPLNADAGTLKMYTECAS